MSLSPSGVGGVNGTSTTTNVDTDVADVLEERLIDAEYKIWKKNTPYLYDFVMTHSLEWPSLTCQWLPTVKNSGDHATEHSLLLGTHTTGEQNYLMIAGVNLPKNDTVMMMTDANTENNNNKNTTTTTTTNNLVSPAIYDEEKQELGGFGHANSTVGKIEIRMKVKHEGEVNRARYMPQNHFVIATRGPSPEIYIWDLTKHPSFPTEESSPFCPQGVCIGHSAEGYGLAWSQHQEGHLISGSEDCTIHLWDIQAAIGKNDTGTQIKPLSVFSSHSKTVEDVDWHPRDPNLIGSVSDDRCIMIWDVREKNPTKPVHRVSNAHDDDVNCMSFNPVNEFVLATGSADQAVAIWDMRNLKS
jgi:histone-binding protein RBBP4